MSEKDLPIKYQLKKKKKKKKKKKTYFEEKVS